jgi:hypothetical protein
MKKTPAKRHTREMRAEYDFSGGIRGKYVDRYGRSQLQKYRTSAPGGQTQLLLNRNRP